LIISGSLNSVLKFVRFTESNVESKSHSLPKSLNCSDSNTALSLVQDLIFITSFACSDPLETQSKIDTEGGNTNRLTREPSITGILISLAPYWAIASLITQLKKQESLECSAQRDTLEPALLSLLRAPVTSQATLIFSENCLTRIALAESKLNLTHNTTTTSMETKIVTPESVVIQLFQRIKKSLRTHLSNLLIFSIVLGLSLRHDLLLKFRSSIDTITTTNNTTAASFALQRKAIIEESDKKLIHLILQLVQYAPKLVIKADFSPLRIYPLMYIVSHRSMIVPTTSTTTGIQSNWSKEYTSATEIIYQLTKCITEYVPSSVTLADSKGMYPLHYAARRGYTQILRYLTERYGDYTLQLMDLSGKFPLHHALLSHHLHREEDIVLMAEKYPLLLSDQFRLFVTRTTSSEMTFKPLQYAKKASKSLYEKLLPLAEYASKLLLQQSLENLFQQQQHQEQQSLQVISPTNHCNAATSMILSSTSPSSTTTTDSAASSSTAFSRQANYLGTTTAASGDGRRRRMTTTSEEDLDLEDDEEEEEEDEEEEEIEDEGGDMIEDDHHHKDELESASEEMDRKKQRTMPQQSMISSDPPLQQQLQKSILTTSTSTQDFNPLQTFESNQSLQYFAQSLLMLQHATDIDSQEESALSSSSSSSSPDDRQTPQRKDKAQQRKRKRVIENIDTASHNNSSSISCN
jgi:hypothetical protein